MPRPQEWPDTDKEQLRALKAAGHSMAEIGRRLGRSANACIGQARRMGLPLRPNPVPVLYGPPMSRAMRRQAGVPSSKRGHQWTFEEIEVLRAMRADRKTWQEMADALGVSIQGAQKKCFAVGIYAPPPERAKTTLRTRVARPRTRRTILDQAESVSPWEHCQWIEGEPSARMFCDKLPVPRVNEFGRVITAAWCNQHYGRCYMTKGENNREEFQPIGGSLSGHLVMNY